MKQPSIEVLSSAAVTIVLMAFAPVRSFAAEGTPVDQLGIPCLSMNSSGNDLFSDGSIKYNYEIKNTCDRGFSLAIIANAGWRGLVDVGPGGIATWFCTDGAKVNKDCNGGANSFEVY